MSNSQEIKLIFFDILDGEQIEGRNDCPTEILDNFVKSHVLVGFNLDNSSEQELKYSFTYQVISGKTIKFSFHSILDHSAISEFKNILTADAYIIFIDLENEKNSEKYKELVTFIKDNCSDEIMTYIVGLYKNNISKNLTKKIINNYIKKSNISYCYDEVCLNDTKEKNYFESILIDVYEEKMKLNNKNVNTNFRGSTKDRNVDKSNCIIY
jgi:hypothetical protein